MDLAKIGLSIWSMLGMGTPNPTGKDSTGPKV